MTIQKIKEGARKNIIRKIRMYISDELKLGKEELELAKRQYNAIEYDPRNREIYRKKAKALKKLARERLHVVKEYELIIQEIQ